MRELHLAQVVDSPGGVSSGQSFNNFQMEKVFPTSKFVYTCFGLMAQAYFLA